MFPTDSNPNAGMTNAIQTSAIEDIQDIDENLSYSLADPSTDRSLVVQGRSEGTIVPAQTSHCNYAAQAAHKMPVSFHGPGPQQVARSFPSKRICQQLSFFRILEGRMTMHTVQGGRSDDTDFLVQLYVAFADISDTDTAAAPPESVLTSPTGLPLGWDIGDLDFPTLCNGLCMWNLSKADYVCLDLPFLSCPQPAGLQYQFVNP